MSHYSSSVLNEDTICALATTPGISAIAVVRVSGKNAFQIINSIFRAKNKDFNINTLPTRSLFYGSIVFNNEWLDDAVLSFFRSPHSYTGEDTVEISCHGSVYIQQKILECLVENGCRLAQPGEFTLKAFLNGKIDLSQAEAVADLIASQSKVAHDMAHKHLKGGFSKKIEELRQQLLKFASLIELELDFSEEDVKFASRDELKKLIESIDKEIKNLSESFNLGNVLKKGIPVTIVGKPNVGKSTLLNLLLNEDRAIVSSIPGTTRDAIEDCITLEGITFRFIDTAGLRNTENAIENMGLEKTFEKIKLAYIILYVFDISETSPEELNERLEEIEVHCENDEKTLILVGNKTDKLEETPHTFRKLVEKEAVFISAKRRENIDMLIEKLIQTVSAKQVAIPDTIVSNVRHYDALVKASALISDINNLLDKNTSTDLLAADLRRALHYLSEITGVQISNEDVLGEIFSSFCIGK